jgi:protein-S-isoprenylcysteine O-methyltransferase Ste14
MEHPLFPEVMSAAFLLFLGGTRCYYFVAACARTGDALHPAADRLLEVPAYIASAVWAIYVAWSILAPPRLLEWDTWALGHGASDLLVWTAVPLFGAGLWLFWCSHRTIGSYWSIRIKIKNEHQLVTRGSYRYVRHPLYTALFLGYIGTLFALQSWALTAWFPVFVASYVVFTKGEERIMEGRFGEVYRTYRDRTGKFFPKFAAIRNFVTGGARSGGAPHGSP